MPGLSKRLSMLPSCTANTSTTVTSASSAPFRTVLGHQATHVEVDFYDRFYHPDALSETQRQHTDRWHDPEAQT